MLERLLGISPADTSGSAMWLVCSGVNVLEAALVAGALGV